MTSHCYVALRCTATLRCTAMTLHRTGKKLRCHDIALRWTRQPPEPNSTLYLKLLGKNFNTPSKIVPPNHAFKKRSKCRIPPPSSIESGSGSENAHGFVVMGKGKPKKLEIQKIFTQNQKGFGGHHDGSQHRTAMHCHAVMMPCDATALVVLMRHSQFFEPTK